VDRLLLSIAIDTIPHAGLVLCMAAIVVTGRPCWVCRPAKRFRWSAVTTSGTARGYVMPGLTMGLRQVGWFAAIG